MYFLRFRKIEKYPPDIITMELIKIVVRRNTELAGIGL